MYPKDTSVLLALRTGGLYDNLRRTHTALFPIISIPVFSVQSFKLKRTDHAPAFS